MKLQTTLTKIFSTVMALAVTVCSFPTSQTNGNTFEFSMRKTNHDEIDWYAKDTTLDSIREKSERSLGNLEQCPSAVKTGTNLPVNEVSTCPWYYSVDHSPNRYPADILIAKTPCTTCIGSNGDTLCHPITRSIQILKEKETMSGDVNYEAEDIEIPVGYTCGSRNMVDNVPQTAAAPQTHDGISFAKRK